MTFSFLFIRICGDRYSGQRQGNEVMLYHFSYFTAELNGAGAELLSTANRAGLFTTIRQIASTWDHIFTRNRGDSSANENFNITAPSAHMDDTLVEDRDNDEDDNQEEEGNDVTPNILVYFP